MESLDPRTTSERVGMLLRGIDHIVMTVASIEATVDFYRGVFEILPWTISPEQEEILT